MKLSDKRLRLFFFVRCISGVRGQSQVKLDDVFVSGVTV